MGIPGTKVYDSWKQIRKLNILGIIWTIKKISVLKKLDPKREAWGIILPGKREIWIYSKIPTERDYKRVLLHEIGHALIFELSVLFKAVLAISKLTSDEILETINDIHSKYLYQVLEDNGLLS